MSADDENIERGKIVLFFKEPEEVPAWAAKLRTMAREVLEEIHPPGTVEEETGRRFLVWAKNKRRLLIEKTT